MLSTSPKSNATKNICVSKLNLQRYMGDWYVLAGRFTFLEQKVHNGLEKYSFNEKNQTIEIDFTYNQGSFDGPKKSIPQKGWVIDKNSNSHWKISPLWPFKFDYLVVAIAEDYSWTAVGVPNQKYLWIMARDWKNPKPTIEKAIAKLKEVGYKADEMTLVPHSW